VRRRRLTENKKRGIILEFEGWIDPMVVVAGIQGVIAFIMMIFVVIHYLERRWKLKKAFLVSHPKVLSEKAQFYGIDIHNQGDGPAWDVKILINGKTISESPEIEKGQNISRIAPRDWITYALVGRPPARTIDVKITWIDGTGKRDCYENRLYNY
jgi:hypothetical protein